MAKGLKHLNEFERFDIQGFIEGKRFEACSEAESLTDFNTGEVLGVRLTLEIVSDDTKYRSETDNIGARFDVKILGKDVSSYAFAGYRVPVELVDVTDAVRWASRPGGARNNLTVTGNVRKFKA